MRDMTVNERMRNGMRWGLGKEGGEGGGGDGTRKRRGGEDRVRRG